MISEKQLMEIGNLGREHEARIAELEVRDAILKQAVEWFEAHRPQWGPGTLPTWYVDATAK